MERVQLFKFALIFFSLNILQAKVFDPEESDAWYTKVFQDTLSPFTTNARAVFIGGAVTSMGFYLNTLNSGPEKRDFIEQEFGEDKPEGRSAKLGDIAGQMVPN